MLAYTTTQELKTNQRVKALYAMADGRQVKILDLRHVYDTNAEKFYFVADVLFNNASLPVSLLMSKLTRIYAMVEQVIR